MNFTSDLKYKNLRNLLSTILKQVKQYNHKQCFESNWNNVKNMWKGIK